MSMSKLEPKSYSELKNEDGFRENAHYFKYIGSILTTDRNESQTRIVESAFNIIGTFFSKGQLPLDLRYCVVMCYVYPILCYVCEFWSKLKVCILKLETGEQWLL